MRKSKIKTKLVLSFTLISLVAVFVIGTVVLTSMRAVVEKEIQDKLVLLTESEENQVFAFLDSLESRTLDFSSGVIRDSLVEVSADGSKSAEVLERLNNHLVGSKKPLDPNLIDIDVLDKNGVVISSTNPEEIGRDKKEDACFLQGKEGVVTIDPDEAEYPDTGAIVLEAAAPLIDPISHEFLGVIVNIFGTEKLDSIISGRFQKEKRALADTQIFFDNSSLAIHLVNRENKILVHGHKYEQHLLSTIDTLPARECFNNNREIVSIYINHFGEEVVGASACLPERGWVLLTEFDAKEAFAPVKNATYGLIVMLVILFLFLILEIFLIAGRISAPIKKLREAANIVAGGDLDHKVEVKTGDELEELAESFNNMAVKINEDKIELKKRASELEGTVLERTKELQATVADLEKINQLMSGRELKMIEMKKQIKELEAEREARSTSSG